MAERILAIHSSPARKLESPVMPRQLDVLLSAATCAALVATAEDEGFEVRVKPNRKQTEVEECTAYWLNDPERFQTIYSVMAKAMAESASAYGLSVSWLETLMVCRYGVGDFYDWHIDLDRYDGNNQFRKVSLSVELSDGYSGGRLEFDNFLSPQLKGSGVAFPSYLRHRVTPVIGGVRYSLVGWAIGPRLN